MQKKLKKEEPIRVPQRIKLMFDEVGDILNVKYKTAASSRFLREEVAVF